MSHAYCPVRPRSFDDAVRIYNVIKPIKGKNAHLDIRPLGRRTNHSERIIKLDDNNYALWCDSAWWNKKDDFDKEDARIRAAVLWERTAEGDFVHVRNDWVNGGHGTHYRFLNEVLPHDLSFYTQNGKQYVSHYVKGSRIVHYLPHDTWRGGAYTKHITTHTAHGSVVVVEDVGPITPELVFKHKLGENFELVSKGYVAPKKIVDKDTKAELKDSIKAFKAWALLMAPMLNLRPIWKWPTTASYKELGAACRIQDHTNQEAVKSWAEANGYGKLGNISSIPPKITHQIVQNDQHPLRVALACDVLNDCNLRLLEDNVAEGKLTESEARTKFNTSFNYHMNRILGLVEEK